MSIVRVTKDKNYFHASNEPFNDQDMSWGARGIMGYLLSKPDGWEVRNYDLYRKSPDGRRKVNGYLNELKAAGYLRRYKVYKPAVTGRGKIEWVTEIYERKEMNPDNVRCIQFVTVEDVTVEDVNVKSVNVEESGHIDITESVITNPVITKESTPAPKNGNSPTADPVEDMVKYAKHGVNEKTATNPQDQWYAYTEKFLKLWQNKTGRYPNQDEKDAITKLSDELSGDSNQWELALTECNLHYSGHRLPVARAIEVCKAGGTWAEWKQQTYPEKEKRTNGRQFGNGSKVTGATNKDSEAIRKAIASRSRAKQGTADIARDTAGS